MSVVSMGLATFLPGSVAALSSGRRRGPALILAGWLVVAGVFSVAVPPLEKVIAHDATSFLPASAPSVHAFHEMDRAFGTGRARSLAFIVLTSKQPLDSNGDSYYRALVSRLSTRPRDVAETQDWVHDPQLRQVLVAHDGRAVYVPVGLTAPPGSPEANRQLAWLRSTAARGRPADVTSNVTGDVATIADFNTAVQHSVARTTVIGVVLVLLILLAVYRRIVTALVPLTTIGLALATARGVVALLGQHGLTVSTYTPSFLTAIVLGAGVDYTVFLIARHHDGMRAGHSPAAAAAASLRNLRGVLIASAATVIIGSSCMALASLSLFRTTGPPLAVAIAVTLVVALTLTPALLTLLGPRIAPRPESAAVGTGWERISRFVATRPARALVAGLLPLLALAALYPTIHPSYDESRNQPTNDDSARGYAALAAHYPTGTLLPDYLLVRSDRDLRDPSTLAALDTMTQAVAKVPGVTQARSITRPLGQPLTRASLAGLSATVAVRLHDASHRVAEGHAGAQQLASGAEQVDAGAFALEAGLTRAVDGSGALATGLSRVDAGAPAATSGAGSAAAGAGDLHAGAARLASGLRTLHDGLDRAVDGLRSAHLALVADPVCTTDPVCSRVRTGLGQIYTAEHDQLAPGLAQAADGAARIADGSGSLADGLARLHAGLTRAQKALDRLAAGSRTLHMALAGARSGAQRLAGGSHAIADGTSTLVADTAALRQGLTTAAGYLADASRAAGAAGAAGFYLPRGALDLPAFSAARQMYLSPDGHTARILVYSTANPFSAQSMHRIRVERDAAALALHHTPLDGAHVVATGTPAIDNDLSTEGTHDFRLVALAVLAAVFLVLIGLLRSLVAPLYLLASVALSFAAAMGVTALVFQHLLGRPIDWTVGTLTFMILVAVGADYNILLMSRIREHAHGDTRAGVARALGATGKVITSAGLIFAGSFGALLAAGLTNLVQMGFAIAVGLLLDTFIVRSLVVPALTVLFGERTWWPRRGATVSARP